MSLRPVVIAGTGSFLPGPPIPSEKVEQVLGTLENAPPKVKKFVENIGEQMLSRGGVKTRHFAVDPETGEMTHNFSMLAEQAARRALDMAGMEPQQLDAILISCPSYDQSTPPTSALLQERLGIQNCAEFEIHSNCSGVGKCTQIAFDTIRSGRYNNVLVAYSQLSSIYLRSCYFNQEKMDKVHAALRWILADGAGAIVLRAGEEGGEPAHRIIDTFVESVGAGRPAGMTAGGAAADLMLPNHQIPELYAAGEHHLWQDFTAVNENAAPLLLQGLLNFTKRMKIDPSTVDHYVVSIPTTQLYDDHIPAFLDKLGITRDKIKFRSDKIGYCGGSATLLHFDEMVREGEIKPGELAVVHAVESSKWMTAGFAVRW
ncbi:MAG TPA: 3-oxoacyl-ACP synthase III family protein [Phycisphaerae bacterium]|nr:3-oxoacyl-ACP synthase III family protein [Phycisphaerae bacterium]HRW53884.1 3-oxoacyl-ACP synthase III family protein [Phycisphaerae bacterium]